MAAPHSLGILLLNHTWFTPELRALGHRVVSAGWAHPHFDLPFSRLTPLEQILAAVPEDVRIDRVVYFDDSHALSVVGLERSPIPSVFYSVDSHHHSAWHSHVAEMFDLTLVAQRDHLSRVAAGAEEHVRWLPLWATIPLEPAATRDIGASFRGTLDPRLHPQRAEFFARLAERVPIDTASGTFADVYPRSKIVVNHSVGSDLNFRVFEAMMSGALLITPRVESGLFELFREGEHLVTYEAGNVDDAASKIELYLGDDESRERIARAGREEVLRKHSSEARACDLVRILTDLGQRPKPRKHRAAAECFLYGLGMFRPAVECETEADRVYRDKLVDAARSSLLESVGNAEPLGDDFSATVLLCKCFLEISGSRQTILEFSERIRSASPGDLLLTLSYLEDLLSSGESERAKSVAGEISEVADELLAGLPPLMEQARRHVLDSLRDRLRG